MLDILLGATMATLARASGYLAGRYRLRVEPPEMPKAICPCDHPISFHADLTGPCSGTVAE